MISEREGGAEVLLNQMLGMSQSESIEAQEAREQRRMVSLSQLPKKLNYSYNEDKDAKEIYDKVGIKVLSESDDLFYNVELPDGWKVDPTEHNMWSHVLDNKGRTRLSVFYKGAFYDRRAFVGIERRFRHSIEAVDKNLSPRCADYYNGFYVGRVLDSEKVVFETKPQRVAVPIKTPEGEINRSYYPCRDTMEKELMSECLMFLRENYPDWEDAFSYWD